MQRLTVALEDETLESLDDLADREHGGDRDAAARSLLEAWLDRR